MPVTARIFERKTVSVGSIRLEGGEVLPEVNVALESAGQAPESDGSNVVVVCHALTGDAHAVGDEASPGWWDGLIGPDRFIDTDQYHVITMNVPGGCDGSTGPSSVNPKTGKPYGSSFPFVSIRDMVRVQKRCLEVLGIERAEMVIGGSMGGMMVLEWGVMYPAFARKLVPIATAFSLTPTAIAYNDIGRQAILSDPGYKNGDYYPGPGPVKGLAVARMLAMVTYRTPQLFEKRFSRGLQVEGDVAQMNSLFQVESYLRHQGNKLVKRFDANSYLHLLKAMDTHDLARDREEMPLSRITAEVLVIGIQEDQLFPIEQQRELYKQLKGLDKNCDLLEISSEYGHDAFLVDFREMGPRIKNFLTGTRSRSTVG
ncbi:homoserine O-acetyltransferase [Melghirimyces thermohalophilus]|uniref:Homoserine O-acetyltransferase n=1 Tax=Melghirimyces thermohalophilus TaxID=1236220 RepID=A0A1G6JT94_9BACL|nr:homoserine O-acetyltransferase [Melghirimyces thermohalophilus]SDC21907.1 homoserine O-acetyltransferase [Melghirimyces thermohalophilus]